MITRERLEQPEVSPGAVNTLQGQGKTTEFGINGSGVNNQYTQGAPGYNAPGGMPSAGGAGGNMYQPPTDPATGGGGTGGTGGGNTSTGSSVPGQTAANQTNAGSFTTPNGLTQPIPFGGMNPNPTAVQQFKWAEGGGSGPGQLNAAAPDGPLAPEFANMQGNVQAGVQKNTDLQNQGWWWDWKDSKLKPPDDPGNVQAALGYISSPAGQNMINQGYKWDLAKRTWVAPNDVSKLTDAQKIQMLQNGQIDPKSIGAQFKGGQWVLPPGSGGNSTPPPSPPPGGTGNNPPPATPPPGGTGNTMSPDQIKQLAGMGPIGAFIAQMLGQGGDNPITKMMLDTSKSATNSGGASGTGVVNRGLADTGSGSSAGSTPGGNVLTNNDQTVMIGGQPMKWNAQNQMYMAVNPIPYGQGGGEST